MKKYLVIFIIACLVFGSMTVFAGQEDEAQIVTLSVEDSNLISNVSDENLAGVEGQSHEDGLDGGTIDGYIEIGSTITGVVIPKPQVDPELIEDLLDILDDLCNDGNG